MDGEAFNAGLLSAYQGERAAVVTLARLRGFGLSAEEQDLLDLFVALESVVGDRLEPLVRGRGLPVALDAARIDQARRRADALGGWPGVVESLGARLDRLIADFRDLRAAGPREDWDALDLLVEHEVALARFGALLREERHEEAKAELLTVIRRARGEVGPIEPKKRPVDAGHPG